MYHPGRQRDNNTNASYSAGHVLTALCGRTSHLSEARHTEMASKKDQRRPDLGKLVHRVCRLPPATDSDVHSDPLPGAIVQGRQPRAVVHPFPDPAHGRNLHAQPLHRMVRIFISSPQPYTQWTLTISNEYTGQPWFSASRTGWARAKTARRATAHRDTSASACH